VDAGARFVSPPPQSEEAAQVSNWNPLTAWIHEPYMRICTESHSLDADSLKNHFKHLCNRCERGRSEGERVIRSRCVQVKSGKYEEQDSEEDGSMWSVETLKKYLEENFEGGER